MPARKDIYSDPRPLVHGAAAGGGCGGVTPIVGAASAVSLGLRSLVHGSATGSGCGADHPFIGVAPSTNSEIPRVMLCAGGDDVSPRDNSPDHARFSLSLNGRVSGVFYRILAWRGWVWVGDIIGGLSLFISPSLCSAFPRIDTAMTSISQPKISQIAVAKVYIGKRLRPIRTAGVDSLVNSITELGVMKDPIHVRQKGRGDGKTLVLIAGGHRLMAAQKLGWDTIPARVWENRFCER